MNTPASQTNSATSERTSRSWFTRGWFICAVVLALLVSLAANWYQYHQRQDYFAYQRPPREAFHSGSTTARERIVLIRVRGTIMPPFTDRLLRSIRRAAEDDRVRGILLCVDSPGGLVADSHEIYHELQELHESKPIYVSMRRLAASGGYYVAMGAGPEGRIFAEPTTWTGSIGVIIPRFDISELAGKIGIESDSLATGPFKDTLNPLRPMSDEERQLWGQILDESYQRFIGVIADNRPLEKQQVKQLATGQIYTASQALANGLIDQIGFEDDALEALKQRLELTEARVISYEFTPTWFELVVDFLVSSKPVHPWQQMMEASVPQALYYCSWTPGMPLPSTQR